MDWLKFLFLAGIVVANAAMIVIVVGAGTALPNYMYAFALELPVCGILVYAVLYYFEMVLSKETRQSRSWNVFSNRTPGFPHVGKFWVSGIAGLCWALNYVCLLLANPEVSGPVQVLFNQLNIVVLLAVSYLFLRSNFSVIQILMVLVIFGLLLAQNLIHSDGPGVDGGQSSKNSPGWLLIYFVGSASIGIAMAWTDSVTKLYKSVFRSRASDGRLVNGRAVSETSALLEPDLDPRPDYTQRSPLSLAQYYLFVNLWAFLFASALVWIPMASYKEHTYTYIMDGIRCLFGGSCKTAGSSLSDKEITVGVYCVWLSSVASFFSAYFAAQLMNTDDKNTAMLSQMGLEIAPFLANVTFAAINYNLLHQDVTTQAWVCSSLVTVISIVYTATKGKGVPWDADHTKKPKFGLADLSPTPELCQWF
eukprot:m.364421 g.364421  ORF g.364421 m.364421 type:complete len:421 (+) comp26959_c0_seq1:86-1348(+)